MGSDFWLTPQAGSPAVDSADAGAPGETLTDQIGDPRADDPNVADTGTGPVAWFDRGAVELEGGTYTPMQNYTVYPDPAEGPLAVRVTFDAPTLSWTANGPLPLSTTFYFGDGSMPVVSDAAQQTHVYKRAGAYDLSLRTPGSGVGLGVVVVGADYTPVAPQRLLDTRQAIGVTGTTPVPAGGDVVLHLPTIDGIDPSDVSAIAANVTVTQPTANGVLTVYPDGSSLPTASNLNFAKGQTVPNMVTVAPGLDGAVRIHNSSAGTVHVILDLAGIYANTGSAFKPTSPVRVLDTRGTLGGASSQPLKPGMPFTLDLSKVLPASATAVVLNVTATQPVGNGFLTVFPTGSTLPNVSNLNYTRGQTVANQVVAQVVNRKVTLQASGSAVHAIVDVSGWFGPTSAGATDVYVPYGPTRILDTRNGTGLYNRAAGPLAPRESVAFYPSSADGCVPVCPLPDAFVLNATATAPTGTGFLTVYPSALPTASTLNFTPGTTVPNQATVQVGGGGGAFVYNGSSGHVQAVVDESGYYFTQQPFYG